MFHALALAVGDLADRRVQRILFRSLLLTLVIFGVIGVLLVWLLRGADPCGLAGLGSCPLNAAASGAGSLVLTALGLWLLFPAVALGVIATFTDDIVEAVEARHYPARAAQARRLGVLGGTVFGVRNAVRVLAYNIAALPLYVILLVTGIGTIALFVAVNGLALGSHLGGMVAARHLDGIARKAWLRGTRLQRWLIGTAVTAMFLVPFVNLLAPLIGAAAMTHLYHRRDHGVR